MVTGITCCQDKKMEKYLLDLALEALVTGKAVLVVWWPPKSNYSGSGGKNQRIRK